ncbi:hypothetical protein BRARA_E03333 [Brassica rapa]|uniref:Anaphase-promoting complex subunit 11 RING-H2 finger domain-containing protein n=1 Tax=Brassica campestris TaxID=3711 RepID=A0A397ZM38_BRACM|nr:hypothetical protein BRARA_E03333 [Brassica rapa]
MHHEVSSWTWNAQDEARGICRMAFHGCCLDYRLPDDECLSEVLFFHVFTLYIIVLSDNNNRWVNALFGVSHGYPRWCHKCDDGLIT